jgi:hypothetical protein
LLGWRLQAAIAALQGDSRSCQIRFLQGLPVAKRERVEQMTYTFSFIGDPNTPSFQWDDPDGARYRIGNLPDRVLPAKWQSLGVSTSQLRQLAQSGAYQGRQIDWGAWALKMTCRQLRDFFAADAEMSALMSALEPDRIYLLVAAEGA